MKNEGLPRGVKRIQLPLNVDERGHLTFLEAGVHVPFEVKRVFWISEVPDGKTRGGHAHWTCHEALFPVVGSLDIELDDGRVCRTLTLDDPTQGVVIPAGVWCELRHFAPGTVCVVLASQEYDARGYVHQRSAWREEVQRQMEE